MKIENFLNQSPLFAVYRAQAEIVEKFQRRLAGEGVHLLQGLILTALLFEDREVRPRELRQTLAVSASNLSHALRDLERGGAIRRATHALDARGYVFSLTAAGRRHATALIKHFDFVQDAFEKRLGPRRTRELVEALSVLTK